MIRCIYRPPFHTTEPRVTHLPDGLTLAEMVQRMDLPPDFARSGAVALNGHEVPRGAWHIMRPKAGYVTFHAPIMGGGDDGGKNPLAVLGALALTVLSGGAAGGLFGAGGRFALTSGGLFAAGSTSALFLAGGISLVGSLLLNALVPPPTLDSGADTRESRRDASARGNLLDPNGVIPRVVGERRVFPNLLTEPLVTFDGDDEIVEAVYALAGPHRLQDIQIGAAPIGDIAGLEIETREGWPGQPPLTLVRRYARTEQVGQELRGHRVSAENAALLDASIDVSLAVPQPQIVATRQAPDVHELQIAFPQGLVSQASPDELLRVPLRLRMRKRGESAWRNLPELHYQGADLRPLRATIRISWRSPNGIAPTAASSKGFVAAFYSTPDQTDAPVSPGWTADAYFYAGSGDTYVDQNNLGSTGLRRYRMDRFTAEFVLDPAEWVPGVWEIEIVRGCAFDARHFGDDDYQYKSHVWDFFAYKGTIAAIPFARSGLADTLALQRSVSIKNANPAPSGRTALIAVRARNQNIERLSVKAGGYVRDWDGTGWNDWTVTSNPAPHYRDVLVGNVGANPLPLENIDDAGLVEWRAACATAGYVCNAYMQDTTTQEALRVIAACGYARPYDADIWGVVRDFDRSAETPVQLFTPRNSANFQWSKAFRQLPDGFQVTFDDAALDYQPRQIFVYRRGAKSTGLIEQVRYEGVTTEADARARALYDLAQLEKRAALFSMDVAWDALACRRGDLVALVHDAVAVNSGFMRVLEGGTDAVRIEGPVTTGNEPEVYDVTDIYAVPDVYALGRRTQAVIRRPDGTVTTVDLTNATGQADVLEFAESVTFVPEGSLLATHVLESEYRRMIVFAMQAKSDYTHNVTLVDEANEVFA